MAAVTICSDFGAQKIKSDTVSTVSPSISHEVMGLQVYYIVKDPGEQPDDDICGARSRRVLNKGASFPLESGCTTLQASGYIH